jgi:hypothetical protein
VQHRIVNTGCVRQAEHNGLTGLMSQSATPTQSEFVAEEFETSVTEETTTQLAQKIEEIVRSLRRAIDDDDVIEELLRNSSRVLREADSVERSDPEPLTQQVLIEPLFGTLHYPTFSPRKPLRSARPAGRLCGLSEGVRLTSTPTDC